MNPAESTMLLLKIMITALSLFAVQARADRTVPSTPNMSCGDHWFEIEVEFNNGVPALEIKGDSVHGETPVYVPKVTANIDRVQFVETYIFSFGDSPESAQTLVASFKVGQSYGEGVYSLVEHDLQTNMNCLKK
jgi:hypothetical protein